MDLNGLAISPKTPNQIPNPLPMRSILSGSYTLLGDNLTECIYLKSKKKKLIWLHLQI